LNTGQKSSDGKTVYVKLRVIAPELSRPVSSLSVPDISRETTAKVPQYLSAGLLGPSNQLLSLIGGPAQNALLTATTGKAPYFVKRLGEGPELMSTARLTAEEKRAGGSQGMKQLKSAASSINPVGALFYDPMNKTQVPYALHLLEEPIPGVRPLGQMYTTAYEPKGKKSVKSKQSGITNISGSTLTKLIR
jgi:hypothetical protein